MDPERAARESPFGSTIAHGFLTLSLIAPTAFELLVPLVHVKSVVNYGLAKVRFMNAVRSGARVRNRITLAGVEDRGANRYLVSTDNTMEIEGQIRPALTAERARDLPRALGAHAHTLRVHRGRALRPRRAALADDLDLKAGSRGGERRRNIAERERALHAVAIGARGHPADHPAVVPDRLIADAHRHRPHRR